MALYKEAECVLARAERFNVLRERQFRSCKGVDTVCSYNDVTLESSSVFKSHRGILWVNIYNLARSVQLSWYTGPRSLRGNFQSFVQMGSVNKCPFLSSVMTIGCQAGEVYLRVSTCLHALCCRLYPEALHQECICVTGKVRDDLSVSEQAWQRVPAQFLQPQIWCRRSPI